MEEQWGKGDALDVLGVRRLLREMVPSGGRQSLALSMVVSLCGLEAEAPDSPRATSGVL